MEGDYKRTHSRWTDLNDYHIY